MDILSLSAHIFAPVFIGWYLKQLTILNEDFGMLAQRYIYYFGVPITAFVGVYRTDFSLLTDINIYVLTVLPMMIVAVTAFVITRYFKLGHHLFPMFIICSFFSNATYIGTNLSYEHIGVESLEIASFISTIYLIIAFTFGISLLNRFLYGTEHSRTIHRIPVLWAALLGLIFSWFHLPDMVISSFDTIAATTPTLSLITAGLVIEIPDLKRFYRDIGTLCSLKLILLPLVTAILCLVVNSPIMLEKVALLSAATPVAVTTTIIAGHFKMRQEFPVNAIIATTLVSIVTLRLFLFILGEI